MLKVLMGVVAVTALSSATNSEDPMSRAIRLVANMTLTEKMGFIQGIPRHASGNGDYIGIIPGVPRLGIPDLRMNDGPEGFRMSSGSPGTSTQWPSGLTVAHSWDKSLFLEWGQAMGKEFYGKGANVQFGPGANVARISNGGRSFEYLSGEDPMLGYTLIQPVVTGIQSQGVVANAKHYINNNQEGLHGLGDRHITTAIVDERTQMEMYYPPFEGAVEAGVLSFMCANNMVNGVYACESNVTNDILRSHGFKGWICSDYDGTRSTIDAANNGLDIAMPGPPSRPDYFGAPLLASIKAGRVAESKITQKVERIVYSLAVVGGLDTINNNSSTTDVTSPEHYALARKLAAVSTTLLKNTKSILPLDFTKFKGRAGSIAVIGYAGHAEALFGGGGSGSVVPKAPVTIYAALASKFGQNTTILTECKVTDNNTDFMITNGIHVDMGSATPSVDGCCRACALDSSSWKFFTFSPGATNVGVGVDDAGSSSMCWCHPDGAKTNKMKKGFTSGSCSRVSPTSPGPVVYDTAEDVNAAAAIAKEAEVAIVVIAQTSREGLDRVNMSLDQSSVVSAIAAVQPNTIVVTISPGPFLTPWRTQVAAILDMGFPGEQEGNAFVDVLFGDVNPGGKMPHTMPTKANEMEMTQRQYPGELPADPTKACQQSPVAPQANGLNPSGGTGAAPCEPTTAYYDEKLLVGYRWYDAHKVTPAFEFGFGLSYTTFEFSMLSITTSGEDYSATFTVKNTGSVSGSEVAQLYLEFPATAGEPPRQLKGFEKVSLASGASATATISLTPRAFSIWDVETHAWTVVSGTFGVMVGSSSRDVRLHDSITIN
eukprot:m.86681 g.86681  ORF g.86681 m.86681 type:complete len:826 (-) comp25989_c0_seq1:109-2586(-)